MDCLPRMNTAGCMCGRDRMKYSEELRKQILDQIDRWPSWRADVMRALLDEIDRLTEQHRWIPVSEGLPEQGADVWIVEKHRHKKTDAQFFDGFFGCGNYELSPLEVVCWMYQVPLPEPTEDK